MYGISSNERPGQAAASSIIFKKVPWMEDEHIYQFIFYGRCIGYFSQAPDKSKVLSEPKLLTAFLTLNKVTNVICLDSRRVCSNTQFTYGDRKITAQNLMSFLRQDRFLRVHTGAHLGDKLELYTALLDCPRIKPTDVFLRLQQGALLNEALTQLIPAEELAFVQNELADAHDFNIAQLDRLQFFPNKEDVEETMQVLRSCFHNPTSKAMMFCGGGKGRTGLFLALFIREICQCSFEQAIAQLDGAFLDVGDIEEVEEYADYVKAAL